MGRITSFTEDHGLMVLLVLELVALAIFGRRTGRREPAAD